LQDLEKAKQRLTKRGLTLSIVKNEKIIFESKTHGISDFLEAVERLKSKLEGHPSQIEWLEKPLHSYVLMQTFRRFSQKL